MKGEMSALLTEGFQPTYKRSRQSAPRQLGAAKPHIFRAISTENNKTAGFVSRRPTDG